MEIDRASLELLGRLFAAERQWADSGHDDRSFLLIHTGGMQRHLDHPGWVEEWSTPTSRQVDDLEEYGFVRVAGHAPNEKNRSFELSVRGRQRAAAELNAHDTHESFAEIADEQTPDANNGPIEEPHPTAFVSYAHSDPGWDRRETERWRTTVLRFTALLREMGIDVELDQFHEHDPEVDWNRFGPRQAEDADFVLIAISHAYKERWQGRNDPGMGAGAVREADTLQGQFNHDQARFQRRVKVVLLPGADETDIPDELGRLQRFSIGDIDEGSVEDLYRMITGQPAIPIPPVGSIRRLPPRSLDGAQEAAIDAARDDLGHEATDRKTADLRIALARIESALSDVPEDVKWRAERGQFNLPWVRTAYEMMGEQQSILNQLAELEASTGTDGEQPAAQPRDSLDRKGMETLVAEVFSAAGATVSPAAVEEIARRLTDPTAGPEQLDGLFRDLPGRTPDVAVQKRVKYELNRHGVLARNPSGRGWILGIASTF